MCGLAGLIRFGHEDKSKFLLNDEKEISNFMKLRGQDYYNFFIKKNFIFAHSRLKITDLSDNGNQPWELNNGNLLIFNGEIFNHNQLMPTEIRKTSCDTEVLAFLLERFDIKEVIKKIRGNYAFAYFCKSKNEIFISNDYISSKPLYYYKNKNIFAFSSDPRDLLYLTNKFINFEYYYEFLDYGFLKGKKTLFKDIHKMIPDELIKLNLDTNKIQFLKVNSIQINNNFRKVINEENLIKNFSDLLISTTQEYLSKDFQNTIFFSSGIDSRLLASVISKACNKKKAIKCLSIGFKDKKYDESKLAKEIAEDIGFSHDTLNVNHKDLFESINCIERSFGEPLGDPAIVMLDYMYKKASQDTKVVFTGDGGDELFGGYSKIRYKLNNYDSNQFYRNQISRENHKEILDYLKKYSCYNSDKFKFKFDDISSLSFNKFKNHPTLYFDLTYQLPLMFSPKLDRTSMFRNVESRTIFLDQRLFETNISNSKYTFNREGRLFEHKLLKYLYPEHKEYQYQKKGFRLPLNKIFSKYLINRYGINHSFCDADHPFFQKRITTKTLLKDIWLKRSTNIAWRKYILLKWEVFNFQ